MRRLGVAVVVAAMIVLSGCGRQVTGLNAPSASIVQSGQTLIRFETNGPLDFTNLTYLIVLNTTGNGVQPYAQGYNSDFRNWSFFFIVGGGSTFAAFPGLQQVYQDPTSGASRPFNIAITQGLLTFTPSVPTGNGFDITFNRCLVDRPTPSASPPPTTKCPPYSNIAALWNISIFTLDSTQSPVDSLGVTGPSDVSYKYAIDTSQVINDQRYFKPASTSTVQNRSAQIVGIEVFSAP